MSGEASAAMNAKLSAGLALVRQSFVDALSGRLDKVVAATARLDDGTGSRADLDTLRFVAHKIHGTASTLGFVELGARAAALESCLDGLGTSPDLPAELGDRLDAFVAEARNVLEKGAA